MMVGSKQLDLLPVAQPPIEMRIVTRDDVADGVIALTMADTEGRRLPDWEPGAHVDIRLGNGLTRQYSLCGDRWDPYSYRLGVLREPASRGGSTFLHDAIDVGSSVVLVGVRNNFALAPSPRYTFIAGGIGITPILPMIRQADKVGADWALIYGGRSRRSMAFLDELAVYSDRVELAPQDEVGLPDLDRWLARPEPDTMVYCCGPSGLIDAVRQRCDMWPSTALRFERFVPKALTTPVRAEAFEVELSRSGRVLSIPPDESILEVLRRADIPVLSSCLAGVCGTCLTPVLDGEPEHRDSILREYELDTKDLMYICVSRSRGPRLVLDL